MSLSSLADALKKEFATLGLPTVLEMAIVSTSGRVLYSDLSKAVMERISPLYNNMLLMGQRDNMSLALDTTKTIIVSRVSNKAILITLTDKKMGIVLTKMEGVANKFGRLLDEFIASEEAKLQASTPISEAVVETPIVPPPEPAVQEVQPPPAVVPETPETVTVTVPPEPQPPAPTAPSVPAIVNEAMMIIDEARKKGVTLRALGGMGVAMHCPSAKHIALAREYPDIDLAGHANEGKSIRKVFEGLEFEPVKRFNALHGAKRLKFFDTKNNIDIDVFLDVFEMCHKLDFKKTLGLDSYTIPLADLLMTKLQIVELNEKDVRDIIAILMDHDVGKGHLEKIDVGYIAELCGDDWGLWKTLSLTAQKIDELVDDYDLSKEEKKRVKERLADLLKRLQDQPKSLRWRMRSKIGEGSKWYETVEEVKR
nr:hypothetical protein [Candidatus Njordarchaeum guaymaensis]